jgi:hypothetical protein
MEGFDDGSYDEYETEEEGEAGEASAEPIIDRAELERFLSAPSPAIHPTATTTTEERIESLREAASAGKQRLADLRSFEHLDEGYRQQKATKIHNLMRMATEEADDLERGLPFEGVDDPTLHRQVLESQIRFQDARSALSKTASAFDQNGLRVIDSPRAKLAAMDEQAAADEFRRVHGEQVRRKALSDRKRHEESEVAYHAERLAKEASLKQSGGTKPLDPDQFRDQATKYLETIRSEARVVQSGDRTVVFPGDTSVGRHS